MKFLINTALLVTLTALTSAVAQADPRARKQPLQVDFNKMIDENNIDRGELAKADPSVPTASATNDSGRRKVIDFVDMEVGVGQTRDVGRN